MSGPTRPPAQARAHRTRRSRTRRSRTRRIPIAVAAGVIVSAAVVLGLHLRATTTAPSAVVSSRMGTVHAEGLTAPNGTYTTTAGLQRSVSSLRGKPTLLWFVATWCSSCQAGTQTMAQNVARLHADGVQVVEIELYQDMGQSGGSLVSFARKFAGAQYSNPGWTFATSSGALTRAYDPGSYLDIYYLLNAHQHIVYVNGSPASTMANLLLVASKVA